MKSIIQDEKRCYICGQAHWIEDHHIFFGTANRKLSEKYGLKVYLCQEHHRGNTGVHNNRELDLKLKRIAQTAFEKNHSREEFISVFGRNYL
jgi:hypothetical protein